MEGAGVWEEARKSTCKAMVMPDTVCIRPTATAVLLRCTATYVVYCRVNMQTKASGTRTNEEKQETQRQ